MSIISFLGLGSVFDTKLPIFGWLYDSINRFVKENDKYFNKNYTDAIRKELERQLYLIVSDHIHERLYQGVHREIEERVRLALMMRYNEEEIRKAVNYMSKSGEFGTAMHYVTCEGYAMILRVLLERRGNPNLQAMKEETPLQRAIVLYNEVEQDFMKEAYLRVISVLLCFQADRQRLKPGTPKPQPTPIEDEFTKQRKSNERGHMSTIAKGMRKGLVKRDLKKINKVLNDCNLGLLNLISSYVPEFEDLTFEIGALFQAVKWNQRAADYFNRGEWSYRHNIDGSLVKFDEKNNALKDPTHPSMRIIDFLNNLELSYYKWALELRDNLEFLTFLKDCFDIIFSHLHRTPEDNPKNGANLLHYFIMIPYYPLCQSVLAHSPELIHRQDSMGNTPLHCAFFAAMEEERVYLPILDKVVHDDYMMHFFNFDKFNLAKQTLLHLITERGTTTNKTVRVIGKMICDYIENKIRMNRHLKVDLRIADSSGWTPFLQLCYKNDPLAIVMAEFAHKQEIDINLTCPGTKYTALHHAVRYQNVRICELLLTFDNFKNLRVTSFDLISKRASLKLIEMNFKYAPLWAITEFRAGVLNTILPIQQPEVKAKSSVPLVINRYDGSDAQHNNETIAAPSSEQKKIPQMGTANIAEKVLLKRLTSHPPSDCVYGEVVWDDFEYLTASPLMEVLIIKWDSLFESIVHHTSLEVVDSCRALKFALELGYEDYVKPLICNLVGVTKEKIKRRGDRNDVNKRLLMDFHEGHLNTWCLICILDLINDEKFIFEECPKVPDHLRNSLEGSFTFNFVVSIDLAGNSLDRIPDCLLFLSEITHLNLLNNDIEFIPDVPFSFGSTGNSKQPLPALKELNISSNRIKGIIPLWIICHKNLEKLSLSMNHLDFVEDRQFKELKITEFTTKLREVNLQRNKLSFIPRYIENLKAITDLNMSNNSITAVPSEMWQLYKLDHLDLADNEIVNIEYPCKNCSELAIDYQDEMDPAIILESQRMTENYCRLRELKLSGNKLKEPPNGLVCITPKLQRLNVKDNEGIKYLDLRYLPRFLRYLDYSGCGIREVLLSNERRPCFASTLNTAQEGLCDHLKLRSCKFLFLSDFYLNGNRGLQRIILGDEEDNEVLYFPSLKYLHLHENDLRSVPPHIGYQKNLETLDISDNPKLEVLPKELGNLKMYKRLQSLRKDNLKLKDIPPEACLPVVLNILRSFGTECRPNRRFKLALVGYQGRGKTTLLKTLQSKSISDILSTEGIDINKWDLINPEDSKEKIEFEAWDFAGQQDYYPTHHCFLSPRSVYLLVFRACDRQKGITELDGWLKSLEMMAPGCPVLLVGTHIDEIEQESLQNLAQEILVKYHPDKGPFPMIADICFITCKPGMIASNKEQVKSLKKAIFEVASHLHIGTTSAQVTYKPKLDSKHANAFINQKVPVIYQALEEDIRMKAKEMKKNNQLPFLNSEEMWTMIGRHRFNEKDLLQDGLEYLHHLGLVLNFETTRLKDIFFLDPQWLSKSMAILIRDHHIRQTPDNRIVPHNKLTTSSSSLKRGEQLKREEENQTATFLSKLLDTGIVEGEELKEYLHGKNQQLCEWIETYVELLERFEVVLKIDQGQILVPSFLPERHIYSEKPMIDFRNLENIDTDLYHIERLWFLDHVPYGFWARFISRLRGDETIQQLFNIYKGTENTNVKYCLSKSTFEIHYKGCTLLEVLMDESSTINRYDKVPGLIKHYFHIMVHVNLLVWSVFLIDSKSGVECSNERSNPDQIKIVDNVKDILPNAAILLHKLSEHYKTLLSNWYKNMAHFVSTEDGKRDPLIFYTPCQNCSRGKEDLDDREASLRAVSDMSGSYVYYGKKRVNIFSSEECIKSRYGNIRRFCPIHVWENFQTTCPDLLFIHMGSKLAQNSFGLEIHSNEILGVGGFGLVCKGTLLCTKGDMPQAEVPTIINDDNDENEYNLGNNYVDENNQMHNNVSANDTSDIACNSDEVPTQDLSCTEQNITLKSVVALKFLVKYPEQKAENFLHFLREEKYTEQELLEMHSAILNEMSFCIKLNHRNVVQLLGVNLETYFYLIFEMAPLGSLKNILEHYDRNQSYIPYDIILKTLEELCTGLLYLHEELKIIHMDLKPDNLLVWSYPRPDRNGIIDHKDVHIKIADYGLVYIYSNMGNKLRAAMGTPGYMAPEVVSKTTQSIEPTADIYAVGIIIYQLLTVTLIPADVSELIYFEERNHHFPLILHSLVRICVEHNPEKRTNSRELLTWIQSPEMRNVQLHIAIKLNQFKSIIRTHYSQTCLVQSLQEKVEESSSSEQTMEGHWRILDTGGIVLDQRHSNLLEKQDVITEKEISMNSIDIAKDTMPPRRVKSLNSQSKSRLISFRQEIHPYSACSKIIYHSKPPLSSQQLNSSERSPKQNTYVNTKFEGLDDLLMPGGEMSENYKCEHACQMFVSYDKLINNCEERSLSFLSINSNRDMSIKLFECKKEQFTSRVNAICVINNSMWLGTDKGEIIIYPDMRELQMDSNYKSKPFFKALVRDTTNSNANMYILDLQHLVEWNCVIATTSLGDIFWLNDDLQHKGLTTNLHCHLSPDRKISAINRTHIIRKNNEIQIWCTRGSISNPLTIVHLPKTKEAKFSTTELKSEYIKQPLQHITSSTYTHENRSITKVWTSVMNRSIIVCWDTDNLTQPSIIDISKALEVTDHSAVISIKSLLAAKEQLYVGTSDGCILRYNNKSEIQSVYKWFLRNVRHIIHLPSEIEWCLNKNAFFPINTENFKCAMDGTYSKSLLLAALGEGFHILRSENSHNSRRLNEYNSDTIVFTIWRELDNLEQMD